MAGFEPDTSIGSADMVHHLDGGDLSCARLLILLRNYSARPPAGATVHLTTSDPVAPIDLPVWCRMTGHTYLGQVASTGRPTHAVRLAHRPVPTHRDKPWHTDPDQGSPRP